VSGVPNAIQSTGLDWTGQYRQPLVVAAFSSEGTETRPGPSWTRPET
jgi:hypothetical protein